MQHTPKGAHGKTGPGPIRLGAGGKVKAPKPKPKPHKAGPSQLLSQSGQPVYWNPVTGQYPGTAVIPPRSPFTSALMPNTMAHTHANGASGLPRLAGAPHSTTTKRPAATRKTASNTTGGIRTHGGAASRGTGGSTGGGGAAHTHPTTTRGTSKPPGPPPKPGPDPISQMIEGALQQSRRLTDFYGQQTEAQRAATEATAGSLASAAGSLSSTTPMTYLQGADPLAVQQANSYTDLINRAGDAKAKAAAGTNQAIIADSGNAFQKLLAGNRDAAEMAHVEYGRRLKASEPAMRRQQASDDFDAQMKQAEQQYLRDKLSLEGQKTLDASQLGWASLAERQRAAQAGEGLKGQALNLSAADKQANAALKGAKLDAATRKEVNAWVKNNLYAKVTNSDGTQTISTSDRNADIKFSQVLADMTAAGFAPDIAARVALGHDPKGVERAGAPGLFKALVAAGMGPRQAAKQVGARWGKKASAFVIRNKRTILAA